MRRIKLFSSSTFRLALIYMALFSTSVLMLLAFIYWSTASYMSRQTDDTIEAEITGLAEQYGTGGLAGLDDVIAERISRKPAGSGIYLLADPFRRPLVGNLDRWPDAAQSGDGWIIFPLEGKGWNEVHWARARPFRLRAGFHLLVGRDIQELQKNQQLIGRTLTWGLVMTVGFALGGGILMSRSILRRIELINQTSREIMSGDLSRRIPTRNTGDDFDELSDHLNSMLDQIESLMDGVRRVSDNIAHDLRTPLARLRHRLEVLRRQVQESGQDCDPVERAVQDADGLLSTFNALLRIARVETADRRERFAAVNLEVLVRDVAELYEPLAEERHQPFHLQLASGVQTWGDPDLLFQAIANLLDNAIKYTPEGGDIALTLEACGEGPRLTVADRGPGIPAADREKVFQRFFRLESSRTAPGNGLGLSLVAAVAKLHELSIRLDDNAPGLRVVIDFPKLRT